MAFTVLVMAQLFNVFNSRSDTISAASHLFTNRWLWAAVGLSLSLQLVVIYLPVLNEAFDTRPLDVGQWFVCFFDGEHRVVGRRDQEGARAS